MVCAVCAGFCTIMFVYIEWGDTHVARWRRPTRVSFYEHSHSQQDEKPMRDRSPLYVDKFACALAVATCTLGKDSHFTEKHFTEKPR